MVTPPAVSKQLKQFDDLLKIRLWFRDGNSIQLTEVGQKVYNKCVRVFDQIKEIENFIEHISRTKLSELRIGCPQSITKYIIHPLILSFEKTYPGIRIVLDHSNNCNSELIKSIRNYKNELVLCVPTPDEKRLKVRILRREDLVLVASPKSKIILTDEISIPMLSSMPLILRKHGSITRSVIFKYFKKFKMTPNIVLESDAPDLTKELVSKDYGVSFLMRPVVHEDILNKKLKEIRILGSLPTIEVGIGYLKQQSLSQGATAFLRLIDKLNNMHPRSDPP